MNSTLFHYVRCIVVAIVFVVTTHAGMSFAQNSAGSSILKPQLGTPPPPPAAEPLDLPMPLEAAIMQASADPAQADDPGYQPLVQGPVHEAFAAPNHSDPNNRGRVISKPPPDSVDEQPPAAAREQEGMKWIPGYWAFSDEANDYVWVSGMWRQPPPGRTWVPGHWSKTTGGYRWTPGYWGGDAIDSANYLPEPPASIDNGPSVAPPGEDYFWVPGHWEYSGSHYQWHGGFWGAQPNDWVWQPACYVATPQGYRMVDGYWDYLPAGRGQLYAPVHFYDPVYLRPNYVYRPRYPLVNAASLLLQLFVRPGYPHYFYGDFYGPSYAALGFRPWYDAGFGSGRTTPWLAYYDWRYRKLGINFGRSMHRHGNNVRAIGNQNSPKHVGGKPVFVGDAATASAVKSKRPKHTRTFDAVVRSDSARVSIPHKHVSNVNVGRSNKGSQSVLSAPPGQAGIKGQDRSAKITSKHVGASSSRGIKSSPPLAGSRSVAPSSRGSGKFSQPSNLRSVGTVPSSGNQGSSFSRGRHSPSFSGGSKSFGRSKAFRGGSKGRGKGKK